MNDRTSKRRQAQMNAHNEENWNPIKARKEIVELGQAVVSLENITKQYHKLMVILGCELRKKDRNNRVFSNGYVSKTLLINIDKINAHKPKDLPPEAYADFKGDNKPGISPDHLRGGK